MDRKRLFRTGWFLVLAGLLIPSTLGFAQTLEVSALGGLKAIYVNVSDMNKRLQGEGLRPERVKSNTENRLKRAGIPVVSDKEYDRLKRSERYPLAVLEIILNLSDTRDADLRACSILARVRQVVFLARKPVIRFWGSTWEERKIVVGGGLDSIEGALAEAADRFIGAFSSANP